MNNKLVEHTVREVLSQYVGSQVNLDSEAARDLIAKHIAVALSTDQHPDDMDGYDLDTSTYIDRWSTEYVDDDLTL